MLAPSKHIAPPGPAGLVQLHVDGKQVNGSGFWNYVKDLAVALEQHFDPRAFEAIHLQHLAFGASPALLRAFPDHPSIALVHGTDLLFAASHPTQRTVLRETARAANAIVVPTTAMAQYLQSLAGRAAGKTVHIPWGIPDHLLTNPPPRRADRTTGLRVLYAGRLTEEKGAAELIDGLAHVDGLSLIVAAPANEYAVLCDTLDTSRVHYLGWLTRSELWQELPEHDLLVVPSARLEAFGLVALEAQACGVPVLYRSVPGLAEVLNASAMAVDPAECPQALITAVDRLCRDRAPLEEYRAAGLLNAQRFPLSRTARELRELTEHVTR
jgi:glycosyltransferase involved in cell wall biosynthesis